MFTKNIFIFFFMVHALSIHTDARGMESDEEKAIEETKFFYCDQIQTRRGIYNPDETSSQNKQNEILVNQPEEDKIVYIYFHGFGEIGDPTKGPVFPDGGLNFRNAAFFTQRNIIIAAKCLKEKVVKGKNNILYIEGKSAGAGILINCLHALQYYHFQNVFPNTGITVQDTQDILAAVNRGKISLSTPALSMEKPCIVAFSSQCASYLTIVSICGILAWKKWLYAQYISNNSFDKNIQIFGFFIASITFINIFGNTLENMFSRFIDRYIIPFVTRGNYDPNYIKPLHAAGQIAPHLHCPVLIHVSRNDEILKNDKDMAKFHNAFHFRENTDSTYFLLSDDDTHDRNNLNYKEVSHIFFNLNQENFTNFLATKQYGISNGFKDKTLLLQDNSRIAKEIADLQKNPFTEFFSLGRSVYQSLFRLK